MTECYLCGEEGHRRSQCPRRVPLPPAAHPDGRGGSLNVVPLRRPPPDPAIARTWAQVIRDTLGWPPPEQETRHD